MLHGSHLYGLDTENSDKDYKGIFLPSLDNIILDNTSHEIRDSTGDKNSKNNKDDIDTVYYSLHKFIKMACDGETIAIDMLHCDDENLLLTSPTWKKIVENRHLFYTKNMKAFLGYCRKQASKYGVKGSRLNAMEDVLNHLKVAYGELGDVKLNSVPIFDTILNIVSSEHPQYVKVMDSFYKGNKLIERKVLEVCDAKYDFTTSLSYVIDAIQKKYNAYGERAQQAKNNEGIDWKALSHALRTGHQLKEIYETGDLQYPLKDREFLLEVKQGKLDFLTVVSPALEQVIEEVEELAEKSKLPSKVDQNYWNNFLLKVYKDS